MVKQHLDLLGRKAKDKVTGFSGIIESISFDLYGCVTAVLRPPVDKKGDMPTSSWFDICRLDVKAGKPAMVPPNFFVDDVAKRIPEGSKGASEKPAFESRTSKH